MFSSGSLGLSIDQAAEVVEKFLVRHTSFNNEHLSLLKYSGGKRATTATGVPSDRHDIRALERLRHKKGSDIPFAARTIRPGNESLQEMWCNIREGGGTVCSEVGRELPFEIPRVVGGGH